MIIFQDGQELTAEDLNSNFGHALDTTVASAQTINGPITANAGATIAGCVMTGSTVDAIKIVTSGSTYAATSGDRYILINMSSPVSITITLPPAVAGRVITIKDAAGTCGAHPITVIGNGGQGAPTIDGAANVVMNTNYAAADMIALSSTAWCIV